MRKLNDFLQAKHPSGLVDVDYISQPLCGIDDKYITPAWYDTTADSIRFFLDPLNGDDANDGSTWAKALKTTSKIQSILRGASGYVRYVTILIPAGTTMTDGFYLHSIQNLYIQTLDIIIVVEGSTNAYVTNNGERTVFGNTTFTLEVKDQDMLFERINTGAIQIKALILTSGEEKCYGLITLKSLSTSTANKLVTARNLYLISLEGVVFDASEKTVSQVLISERCDLRFNSCLMLGSLSTSAWRGAVYVETDFIGTIDSYKAMGATYAPPFIGGLKIDSDVNGNILSFGGNPRNVIFNGRLSLTLAGSGTKYFHFGSGTTCLGSLNFADVTSADVLLASSKSSDLFKVAYTNGEIMPPLPISDPAIVGALWNDTGTVKVSAG
jgi:hypothetical protein